MAMATNATAMGRPLPIWPYVLPRRDDPTPSRARVVARPNEKETALQWAACISEPLPVDNLKAACGGSKGGTAQEQHCLQFGEIDGTEILVPASCGMLLCSGLLNELRKE